MRPRTIVIIIAAIFVLYFAGNAIGQMLVALSHGIAGLGTELEKIPAR